MKRLMRWMAQAIGSSNNYAKCALHVLRAGPVSAVPATPGAHMRSALHATRTSRKRTRHVRNARRQIQKRKSLARAMAIRHASLLLLCVHAVLRELHNSERKLRFSWRRARVPRLFEIPSSASRSPVDLIRALRALAIAISHSVGLVQRVDHMHPMSEFKEWPVCNTAACGSVAENFRLRQRHDGGKHLSLNSN